MFDFASWLIGKSVVFFSLTGWCSQIVSCRAGEVFDSRWLQKEVICVFENYSKTDSHISHKFQSAVGSRGDSEDLHVLRKSINRFELCIRGKKCFLMLNMYWLIINLTGCPTWSLPGRGWALEWFVQIQTSGHWRLLGSRGEEYPFHDVSFLLFPFSLSLWSTLWLSIAKTKSKVISATNQ